MKNSLTVAGSAPPAATHDQDKTDALAEICQIMKFKTARLVLSGDGGGIAPDADPAHVSALLSMIEGASAPASDNEALRALISIDAATRRHYGMNAPIEDLAPAYQRIARKYPAAAVLALPMKPMKFFPDQMEFIDLLKANDAARLTAANWCKTYLMGLENAERERRSAAARAEAGEPAYSAEQIQEFLNGGSPDAD